jgi:hypothetical protein
VIRVAARTAATLSLPLKGSFHHLAGPLHAATVWATSVLAAGPGRAGVGAGDAATAAAADALASAVPVA